MEKGYPEKADDEWVKQVTQLAVYDIVDDDGCPTKVVDLDKKEEGKTVSPLHRIVRGFIVEFLRQNRDNVPDLNITSITKVRRGDEEAKNLVVRESLPGRMHVLAAIRKMHSIGIPENDVLPILSYIIRHSIMKFNDEYEFHSEGVAEIPLASILNNSHELVAKISSIYSPHSGKSL